MICWLCPRLHFALDYHGAPGLRITPVLSADLKTAEIHAEAWVTGTAQSVQFTLGEETLSAPVTDGKAEGTFKLENVHLWDGVNDPYLYKMQATLDSGDAVEANFGCRTIAFDAEKGFILNGRPYRLCGAARHQDRQGLGNALTEKEHDEDMALLREMARTPCAWPTTSTRSISTTCAINTALWRGQKSPTSPSICPRAAPTPSPR